MSIPNPNPNIADGIKCDNKTYSSNKIESLIKIATELPIPEAGDAGKVLTVNASEDGYELTTPVDPTSIIDDSSSSESTVYSSDKVDNLLTAADNAALKVETISYNDLSVSVNAGSYNDVFYNKDISAELPTGAKIKAIVVCSTSPMSCIATQVVNSDTNASIAVFNPGSAAITITTVTFKVLYTL